MGERLSNLFPLVLLVLLAALSYWLDRAAQSPFTSPQKPLSHAADYSADKLLATRMDLNGSIRDTLYAVKMVHFADDDSTELEQPRFITHGQGAPLGITSKHARVSSHGGHLYFRGEVRITRAPPEGNNTLTVTTEYLHVMPDDHIAKTDHAVTLREPRLTLSASGMELNTETRVLKLTGGVKGVYHDAKSAARP